VTSPPRCPTIRASSPSCLRAWAKRPARDNSFPPTSHRPVARDARAGADARRLGSPARVGYAVDVPAFVADHRDTRRRRSAGGQPQIASRGTIAGTPCIVVAYEPPSAQPYQLPRDLLWVISDEQPRVISDERRSSRCSQRLDVIA
jgi:hypothetical protein